MLIDFNLIAYDYYRNPYVPNDIYTSGEKDETMLINRYSPDEGNTVLVIEDDIINKDGFGLKKGFYNIKANSDLDTIILYQSGSIKAKVPVVNVEILSNNEAKPQKVKKMSKNAYKRKLEKDKKKYFNGINPDEMEYYQANINYLPNLSAWVIEYQANNLILTGIIKF